MPNHPIELINESRHYEAQELFFSLTDEKGRITYGNEVFTRISGYEERELLGKAHSIVRHPDMPRCVFKLLWTYLESGRSIAAYVKNLAKDGRHYWVLATVTPCRGGYLSVRLKPSTVLFGAARDLYARTLELEQRVEREAGRDEAMRRSAEFLLEQLRVAGFDDYDAFMRAALSLEMTARDSAVASVPSAGWAKDRRDAPECLQELCLLMPELVDDLSAVFDSLDLFKDLSDRMLDKQEAMEELGPSLAILSINANISAARMGEEGVVLSVVSRSLGERSKEADQLINTLVQRIRPLCSDAQQIAFEVAVALLESQVVEAFAEELCLDRDAAHDALVQTSLGVLTEELISRVRKMNESLMELRADLGVMAAAATGLESKVRQMMTTQMNGRIEIASCREAEGFDAIFADVAQIVGLAQGDCEEIAEVMHHTGDRVGELLGLEKSLSRALGSLATLVQRVSALERVEPEGDLWGLSGEEQPASAGR